MSRSPRLTWRYRFSSLLQVFQQPRHIAPQRAHGLQSFYILTCFAEQSAVDAIPILRRNHRHVADSKIFVQAVKCRTGSSATTHGHRCSRLVNQQVFSRIEQTVKQGAKRAVRTGVIHRRPNDNSVGCFQFFSDFLIQFSGVNEVYSAHRLLLGAWTPEIHMIRNGFHRKRSGDL